jgi:hypothetical protein
MECLLRRHLCCSLQLRDPCSGLQVAQSHFRKAHLSQGHTGHDPGQWQGCFGSMRLSQLPGLGYDSEQLV